MPIRTRQEICSLHQHFCSATRAPVLLFFCIFLSACAGQKTQNPNTAAPPPEDGTMVDNGNGQLFFRKIKKATSSDAREDRLQAAIRASEARDRKDGELFVRGGTTPVVPNSPKKPRWTIALKSLTTKDLPMTDQILTLVKADVPNAIVERRESGTFIASGWFESPTAPGAAEELKRLQELEVKGLRPYSTAMFVAPEEKETQSAQIQTDLDLRAMVAPLGPKEARYTLQVAIYGRPDRATPSADELKQFRSNAEEAARILRKDGDEAYVLHTPRQSIVTVGIFNSKDIQGEESQQVALARKRHPHLLLNGEGIKVRGSGTDAVLQNTQIVEIPRK